MNATMTAWTETTLAPELAAELADELHAEAVANGVAAPKPAGTTGGSWVDSPACVLVATHCCACNHPLVNALSVTSGIGPECAKKYGAQAPQAEPNFAAACVEAAQVTDCPASLTAALNAQDALKACNVATYYVAAKREGRDVAGMVAMVHALGFHVLAEKLVENLKLPAVTMTILADKGLVAVSKTPFLTATQFATYLAAIKGVPGRKWNQAAKQNEFPFSSAPALRQVLRATFKPGTVVIGARITAL
jgi:hypothetical protein